ncbi:MAG: LOG family protein [Akkermansiaceae bacterium]|jgi:uncharacterized protein (TIGR00730 family)|tara:strand:+ start:43434 stop:44534 length:1101 start_codon:yes stop_codon:yes gene_type:complete
MSSHVKPTKVPQERDFTGGMIHSKSCAFIGSTGEKKLDERIMALAREISGDEENCLLSEMLISAVRISRGAVTEGDFKTMNRALKEMRIANEVFYPYRNCRKISVFGSARTDPEEPEYKAAVEFSRKMRDAGFMTITGAGPGIMAAGNEGAGREDSFGLNINLPFEAASNAFIAGDEKLVDFDYFFTRKLSFVKESDAVAAFPGGFGTMDEIFETLTLIQTGKTRIYPLVLVDAKGGTYWKFWQQFVEEHLSRLNLISDSDFSLFKVTDDVDEAVEEVTRFYSNFHSYRYVGDKLVIRMQRELTEGQLKKLRKDFSDILKSGDFKQCGPLDAEDDEPLLDSLPRLVFRHRRRNFGRLRELIDAINA